MVINTLNELLQQGQERVSGDVEQSASKIEKKFAQQVLDLNFYMYTTETTQYPERIPNFEPFRVEGVVETLLLKRVLNYLETFYPARFQYVTETPAIPSERAISVHVKLDSWDEGNHDYRINKREIQSILDLDAKYNFGLPGELTRQLQKTLSATIIEDTDEESKNLYEILLQAFEASYVEEESPARESPARESPSRESPARESPARESPSRESPARESPSRESPSRESPSRESPSRESPSNESLHSSPKSTYATDYFGQISDPLTLPFIIPLDCDQLKVQKMGNYNKAVIAQLRKLYTEWLTGNMLAVVEANYLVDYHCTQILYHCENPSLERLTRWTHEMITDDIIKNIPYHEGLQEGIDILIEIRNEIAIYLKVDNLIKPSEPVIPVDWISSNIDLNDVQIFIRHYLNEFTTYSANAYGFYRFIALDEKTPSSQRKFFVDCITKALISTTLLALLNFPRERIYSVGKRDTQGPARKKQTHWSYACFDPIKDLMTEGEDPLPNLKTLYHRKIDSQESFATYTRDIIYYYETAIDDIEHLNQKELKMEILGDLINKFDAEFSDISEIIKTPSISPEGE